MRLSDLVGVSQRIGATRSRRDKVSLLSSFLRALNSTADGHELVRTGASYLAGVIPQGKVGVGHAVLHNMRQVPASPEPQLSMREVDETLSAIKATAGGGSGTRRRDQLFGLLSKATVDEQSFLFRLLLGELRQGALELLMTEAVAQALVEGT